MDTRKSDAIYEILLQKGFACKQQSYIFCCVASHENTLIFLVFFDDCTQTVQYGVNVISGDTGKKTGFQ